MSSTPTGAPAPRPGRRARAAPQKPPRRRDWLLAVAVVVLAGVGVSLVRPADTVAPAVRVRTPAAGAPLTHQVLGCPGRTTAGSRSRVVAGSAPVARLGAQGRVVTGTHGGTAEPLDLSRGGQVDVPTSGEAGPVLRATGQLAAGLFAARSDRDARWLAAAPCVEPRASWWFTGAGATLDHTSRLVLTDLDPGPAVVDVRAFGPRGEVSTIGTLGITLGPGERRVLDLRDVAPQTDEIAVAVHASRGRVVASVADYVAARPGDVPGGGAGHDWLPAQSEPRRSVLLSGVVPAASSQTLVVANTSELQAVVHVDVAGPHGRFAPSSVGTLQVSPGSVSTTDLTQVVGRDAVAVRVRSQIPVTATLRSGSPRDVAYAAPVSALTEPAAVPLLGGRGTDLQLTSGAGTAQARVTAYRDGGTSLRSVTLTFRPGTTRTWTPPGRSAYVVVRPVHGAVFGAAVSSAPGTAVLPLDALQVRVRRPAVVPGLGRSS